MKARADSLYDAFGKLVRAHSQRLGGMTQAELGRRVGLSRTSVNNIENGRHHASLRQLFALSEALQVSPQALLPDWRKDSGPSKAEALLPGEKREIVEWVDRLVGDDHGKTTG